MRRPEVEVENVAEIVWGALLVVYLAGAGRAEFLRPAVLAVFGLSAAAAFVELYLRRIKWRWLVTYDSVVWTVLLSAMVAVTGGRGSEVWPAYMLMSLTAPSVGNPAVTYGLMAINSLIYLGIYWAINPLGVEFNLALVVLRVGSFFLVSYVVDRSMDREREAKRIALEVAQTRVSELVHARDAERRRIAGDIHDWLGTGIVAPMRKLELAVRSQDLDTARARVEDALEILSRSHQELRRVMENLHPHLLEQMGLSDGLHAYLQQWGEEHEIAVRFVADAGPEPPADLALAFFRVQQEALNNVLKHAQATRVTVELRRAPGRLTLSVADNGQGFDHRKAGGRGLTGMSERAQLFGGSVTIHSRSGEGTRVVAELPLAGDE